MRAIVAKITFPAFRDRKEIIIRKPADIRVQSGFKTLTDTAVMTMGRNVTKEVHNNGTAKFFDKFKVREEFRAGDPVIIEMGYIRDYTQEFAGYISAVSDDIPIRIEMQDEMWKLKRMPVHLSLQNAYLDSFLAQICPGYEIDADRIELGPVRFVNSTVSQVLEQLQNTFGFYSYFVGKKLVCGKYYADDTDLDPVTIRLEDDVTSHDLVYRHADDLLIEVKAVSTLRNGDKIEVSVGDPGGETRQLSYYNIQDKDSLKKLAEMDYEKYKQDSYSGTVTLYGRPVVRHGMKVDLVSRLYPERNGLYYVDAAETGIYTNAQYRRTLVLGQKVTM